MNRKNSYFIFKLFSHKGLYVFNRIFSDRAGRFTRATASQNSLNRKPQAECLEIYNIFFVVFQQPFQCRHVLIVDIIPP